MNSKMPRTLSVVAGTCLSLALASVSQAQQFAPYPQSYPVYPRSPWTPGPGYPCPPAPPPPPTSQPGPPPPTEQSKEQPKEQQQQQQPEQQPQEPTAPETTPETPTESAPSSAESGTPAAEGTGAEVAGGVPIGGRGDSNNRFNIFDNMSALPTNRLWTSYQLQQGFVTGVGLDPKSPTSSLDFGTHRNVSLYRMGGEWIPGGGSAIGPNFSVAFQSEYIGSTSTIDAADAWGNPQAMFKLPVINSCGHVVSLTLGIQPQTSSHNGELHEKTTRFYPGFLFLEPITCRLFLQGGFQAGISDRNAPNTIDYALSLGYWLYKCPQCSRYCKPYITGLVPQVEVLGKHVVGNDTNNPFEIAGDPAVFGSSALFREPKDVVDVTTGGQVLLGDTLSVGTYFSFPVTGGRVRQSEVITTLNINF